MTESPSQTHSRTPYVVSVEQYRRFRRDGFLIVRGLVSSEEVAALRAHTEDLMQGRLPEQRAGQLDAPPTHLTPQQKAEHFLRIHMLHRQFALHERFLLHPRVLDVLEVIIGPDVLALQTMLFLKGPGQPGQGWHQDSFYLPTHPDTLCGAWTALDDVDEQNGALWFAQGSHVEPVYPPDSGYGFGDVTLRDLPRVRGASNPDDEHNDLAAVAAPYPQVLATMRVGDVAFFGGHVLHRSKANWSADRFRRAFVGHYCNARSFTQWSGESPGGEGTGMTNGAHILARGDTHLPFARPAFGTLCAALLSPEARRRGSAHAHGVMGDPASGLMGMAPADPARQDDD